MGQRRRFFDEIRQQIAAAFAAALAACFIDGQVGEQGLVKGSDGRECQRLINQLWQLR